MLLYIWQTNYIVINIASLFCGRKKSLLYFKIFSVVYSEIQKTQESQAFQTNAFTLTECICGSFTTMAQRILAIHIGLFFLLFFFLLLGKWTWFAGLIHSYHTYSLCPESEENEQVNHLTYFHPISRVECVHFLTNGMSFCRSLWSRINPGIKTDFPGSNLPSSIDFFTLMESVLPNLT